MLRRQYVMRRSALALSTLALSASLAGCGTNGVASKTANVVSEAMALETEAVSEGAVAADTADVTAILQASSATDEVHEVEVRSGQSVTLTVGGTYRLTGQATEATIVVDVADTEKVTLELAGLTIENSNFPAIYVRSADKVQLTSVAGTENALSVTGTFISDGDTLTDGVIFSKDDLVLDGEGSLTIASSKHAVVSKDDLEVKGGTYALTATSKALTANDTLTIEAGTIEAYAAEGLEATVVSIEGGDVRLVATDDGINATPKSDKADIGTPTIAVSGGELAIEMGQGDTDALDSNGNICLSGGIVTISAQFAFDFDGEGQLTGATVVVNGEQVTTLTNSMMGGGRGGFGGRM